MTKKKTPKKKLTAVDITNAALKKLGKVYGKSPAADAIDARDAIDAMKELNTMLKDDLPPPSAFDNVNHPAHYTQGGIECIDAIRAALTEEEFRGFCKGNMIKYIWRERHKGGNESLEKSVFYSRQLTEGPHHKHDDEGDGDGDGKSNRVKYTCAGCEANAWGKPELNIMCGDCEQHMQPAED